VLDNQRFKDVVLSLGAAMLAGTPDGLRRIQLQKFIYLQDVLIAAWREIAKPSAFVPWDRGPYDSQIQNAVDALAFRGFVDVSNLVFRATRNARSTYRLTSHGLDALASIRSDSIIDNEFLLAEAIAKEIDRRGWNHIVDLVYAEPTYVSARNRDDSRSLRIDDPSQNMLLQIVRLFQNAWTQGPTLPSSPDCFVQIAFLVLDEYRQSADREKLPTR
jgi:uncharacterized protein YwgA